MTHDDVQAWLDDYIEAWRSYDAGKIGALFTDDAVYRYNPDGEPVVGSEAIARGWIQYKDTDLNANPWTAEYRPWVVEGDRAIAIGHTHYEGAKSFHNCFQLTFREGRCAEFVEWFMEAPVPE